MKWNTTVLSRWVLVGLMLGVYGVGCSKQDSTADAVSALLSVQKITFTDVTTTSLIVHWTTSSVVTSPLYQVYYTATAPDKSVLPATVLSSWVPVATPTAGSISATVSDLTENTTYYFTVVVEDTTKKPVGMYTVTSHATAPLASDTHTPTLPTDDIVVLSLLSSTGVTLTWSPASDATTATADLLYQAYYSTSNLTSLADWKDTTKATPIRTATAALTTVEVDELTANQHYYFMIIVTNGAGNSALYTGASATTSATTTTAAGAAVLVPGAVGALTFTGATTTGFTVEWAQATDAGTPQASLIYQVFYSTSLHSVDSAAHAKASVTAGLATASTAEAGISGYALTGLTSNTLYYVLVVVEDGATPANVTAYNVGSFATLLTSDTVPPTATSSIITPSSVGTVGVTVTWIKATDDRTAQSALQYQVFYAPSSVDISTVSAMLANGTAVFGSNGSLTWQSDINAAAISSLNISTAYHFNVLVRDSAGNMTAYTQLTQSTTGAVYMFTTGYHNGSMGGRSGADTICNATRTSIYSSLCSTNNTHALLSVSSTDYIANFTTQYPSLPTTVQVIDALYGYQISTNWSTLYLNGPCLSRTTSGSTCNAPGSATQSLTALLGANQIPWTGSLPGGTFDSTNNCSGWTSTAGNGTFGNAGSGPIAGRTFLSNNTTTCSQAAYPELYCICW